MSQPIYLLIIATDFTEAWYQLSEGEQNDLWGKVQEIDKRAGAEFLLSCTSRWADETTQGFGVIKYPNMDAYLKKVEDVEKLNWWRYFRGKTLLGTLNPVGDELPAVST